MPYPFAHPAAVLPLARPLGRFAVPSALAIGSVVPDLWYFVAFVDRADSHGAAGLFWFCLPVGLLAYALFHAILKQPLIALISPRLGSFTCAGMPPRPWQAVVVSLLVGSATHVLWDGLTHSGESGPNWLQHASTAAGSAILAVWLWKKLRTAPRPAAAARLPVLFRVCIALGLIGAMAISALCSADNWLAFDVPALRQLLRTAGIGALEGLGVGVLVYCLLFQRKML